MTEVKKLNEVLAEVEKEEQEKRNNRRTLDQLCNEDDIKKWKNHE